MSFRQPSVNFSKGEIGPELYSRVDVQAYNAALKQARNVKVRKYGGVTKRTGTRFIAEAYEQDLDNPVRLIPFVFNDEQTYALEFGQAYMRPLAAGGLVIEGALTITAISQATNALIACAYHGYVVGDQVFFSGVLGMAQINGRIGTVVTVPSANSYTIDIDTSEFSAFTGDSGGTTNTTPPATAPTAPVVPAPVPDPTPPVVTKPCVTVDTHILMADGSTCLAGSLVVGDMLLTRHEHSLEWGKYPITAISFEEAEIMAAFGYPRATPGHRFHIAGKWVRMDEIGLPAGRSMVAKITVEDAHTYMSDGVLSHNIKKNGPTE